MEDKKGPDDEFRGRHVLAGEHPGELAPGLELVGADGLAVEFVKLVEISGQRRDFRCHDRVPPSRAGDDYAANEGERQAKMRTAIFVFLTSIRRRDYLL